MIKAVNKDEINIKDSNDKTNVLNDLINSLDNLNASPKLQINKSSLPLIRSHREENEIYESCENMNGGERRHYKQNPNLIDNVKFEHKDYYNSPNERIEQLVKYYSEVGDQDKNYAFSQKLHSFYNKGKVDPLIKYAKKVRGINVLSDNPFKKRILNFLKV